MVRKEKSVMDARMAGIILSLILLALMFAGIPPEKVGIYSGSSVMRVFYPFFHVSFIHVLLNVWCLLSIVFIYRMKFASMVIAYFIAISFPVDLLSDTFGADMSIPIVGLSGMCFAMIGDFSLKVHGKAKIKYHLTIASYIILGFLFPGVSASVHLYCYIFGILFGYNKFKR